MPRRLSADQLRDGWTRAARRFYAWQSMWDRWVSGPQFSWIQRVGYWPLNVMQRRFARAMGWGIAIPFVVVNLVPGAVARYSMPAIVPACWLLAMICSDNALQWPQAWMRIDRDWMKVGAGFVALGLAIGAIGYPLTAVILRNRQEVKKAAEEINSLVPASETLYAVNPDYQPTFFYVKPHVKYVSYLEHLPPDTRYFLVRIEKEPEALAAQKWAPLRAQPIAHVHDYSKREMVLFKVAP